MKRDDGTYWEGGMLGLEHVVLRKACHPQLPFDYDAMCRGELHREDK